MTTYFRVLILFIDENNVRYFLVLDSE